MAGLPGGRTTCRSELVNWVCWCWKSTRHRNLGQNQNHLQDSKSELLQNGSLELTWLDYTLDAFGKEHDHCNHLTEIQEFEFASVIFTWRSPSAPLYWWSGWRIDYSPRCSWYDLGIGKCIKLYQEPILIVNHCWLLVLGRNMCAH